MDVPSKDDQFQYIYETLYQDVPPMDYTNHIPSKRRKSSLYKCCAYTGLIILILIILLFLFAFVLLPLIVMSSISVQTFFMFPNIDEPRNPEYNNFQKYGAEGTRNFYVGVEDYYNNAHIVYLGIWHLVPETLIDESKKANFSYENCLRTSSYNTVLYFHGNSGTRIRPLDTYLVLRKHFHVIAVDYRSYADSTEAPLSELAVVSDMVHVYKWLMRSTNPSKKILIWGHSLGAALATHTVASLKDGRIIPGALFLEAPFTTMKEEIPHHPLGKIFAWLPWFDATIVEPMQENGFFFDNKKNILNVDCCIMIMNAEDDSSIPYTLGEKLYEIARTQRDLTYQGNVTYHRFPSELGYNHLKVTSDPDMVNKIVNFLASCD